MGVRPHFRKLVKSTCLPAVLDITYVTNAANAAPVVDSCAMAWALLNDVCACLSVRRCEVSAGQHCLNSVVASQAESWAGAFPRCMGVHL